MQTFIDGMISYMQLNATGFRSFIGSYTNGNNQVQYGPFLDQAPESMHNNFPYMVFNIVVQGDMDQGFASMYTEKPIIRFHFFDTNPTQVGINVEKFAATMDTNPTFTLNGTDRVKSVIRREPAQPVMANEVNENGQRVYHWVISYEFRVVRTKGSYYVGS